MNSTFVTLYSYVIGTRYVKTLDTRFIFSVYIAPDEYTSKKIVIYLKDINRGHDVVVVDDYIILRQAYVHPNVTLPEVPIALMQPVRQTFYTPSTPVHNNVEILDFHEHKPNLQYLFDIMSKLNTDYTTVGSLETALMKLFNMEWAEPTEDILAVYEMMKRGLEQSITSMSSNQYIVTARSGYGKSWFSLKSIMEVYRNSEVDLGGTKIMKVTFNYPATIVEWDDGTKTVVKARDNEPFDHEKGLAMAIAKKALGNDNSYYMIFKDAMYEPVEKKPKDWNTNYTEYFTRTRTDYKPVGIIVDRKTGCAKVPEFVSGKYYKPKKTYLGAN